jgi:hypothetical protein
MPGLCFVCQSCGSSTRDVFLSLIVFCCLSVLCFGCHGCALLVNFVCQCCVLSVNVVLCLSVLCFVCQCCFCFLGLFAARVVFCPERQSTTLTSKIQPWETKTTPLIEETQHWQKKHNTYRQNTTLAANNPKKQKQHWQKCFVLCVSVVFSLSRLCLFCHSCV